MKLLIVDDEEIVQQALADVLADDFEVITASDGREGLDMAEREHPDAVVLDMEMPGLDGLATCREMRKRAALQHVPILVLSGHNTDDDARAVFEAGANDYVVKPFAPSQLRARLRSLLLKESVGQTP